MCVCVARRVLTRKEEICAERMKSLRKPHTMLANYSTLLIKNAAFSLFNALHLMRANANEDLWRS